MYDMQNITKFEKLSQLAPEAFKAFAAALPAGGAMTHGTHTFE